MKLGLKAMVMEHGPRVLAACEKARDTFYKMDKGRKFTSLQEIDEETRLAVNDDIVIIPIANEYKDGVQHGINAINIARMLVGYVDDIKHDIKHNHETKGHGKAEIWVAQNVWAIEKSMRGETDIVTIGLSLIALRMLALLEVHVATKDESNKQKGRDIDWVKCHEHFRGNSDLEKILAQRYIQNIIDKTNRIIGNDPNTNLDWIETMRMSYEIENVRPGQIEIMDAEILPGEVFAVVAISQSIDKEGYSRNIYIDGTNILVSEKLPHTTTLNLDSKKIQNLFNHPLISDLDITLTSDGFVQDNDTTTLFFKDHSLIPLQVKNTPASWTDPRNF